MKRSYRIGVYAFIAISLAIIAGNVSLASDGQKDPNQLFFAANVYYEQRDYVKALQNYDAILGLGVESGNLYYNIGNAFLKLGKIGYAILYYDKAERLIPRDGDLKSNLSFAASLAGVSADGHKETENRVVRIIRKPFSELNLNALAISCLAFYLILIFIFAALIITSIELKRWSIIIYISSALFAFNLGAFALRYYDEVILRHGIVVKKNCECKYEPIDKSMTYYTLPEGSEILVLKTRSGWRQIKSIDGKVAWVGEDYVEEI